MSKLNLFGFIFCGGGVVYAIFEGIQSMMTAGEVKWEPSALVDIMDESKFVWIDNLSSSFLQNTMDTLVTLPLFGFLIAIGVVLLILGGMAKQ